MHLVPTHPDQDQAQQASYASKDQALADDPTLTNDADHLSDGEEDDDQHEISVDDTNQIPTRKVGEEQTTQPTDDKDLTSDEKAEEEQSSLNKTAYEQPERATGNLFKWKSKTVPQENMQAWETTVKPKLDQLLAEMDGATPISRRISIHMAGFTESETKTTIFIECQQSKTTFEFLMSELKLEDGWAVIVTKCGAS